MTPSHQLTWYFILAAEVIFVHGRLWVVSGRKQRPVPGDADYQLPREHTARGIIEARLSPEGEIASWVPVSAEPDPSKHIRLVVGKSERLIPRA